MSSGLGPEQLRAVGGLLPGGLEDEIAAQLPAQSPPAPWHSRIEMAAWVFRATSASGAALPAGWRPGPPLGAAAFIAYLDGAVGPYREILASPRAVAGPGNRGIQGHVPFIAVDSIDSIHGGRANWALPKRWADFTGSPAQDRRLSGTGDDWQITAALRPLGPWFPFRAAGACAQPWPDGTVRSFVSRFWGRARLARVTVTVSGPDELTRVLPGGGHAGLVVRGEVDVEAPGAPAQR